LVLGFIAGAAGGVLCAFYSLKNPDLLSHVRGGSSSSSQTLRVDEDSAVVDVVKKASPAVVSIIISRDVGSSAQFDPFGFFGSIPSGQPNIQEVGAGSGFFISKDGMILTNKHVAADEKSTYKVITSDGTQYDAKVLARDPVNDIALMKIEIQNAPVLELADSSDLQIGSRVIAIGNSLGEYQNTVTTGVISGIGRSITAGDGSASEELSGVIQTDAAINPGNSGGPLLNISGQVIGMNTAIDSQGQLVGFAIQANDARWAIDSYKRLGKIVRPYLGIRYVLVNKVMAQDKNLGRDYGALVLAGDKGEPAVIAGGPADSAGVKEGDIILSINGNKVDQSHSIISILRSVNPGDVVSLIVFRDGKEMTLSLKVGER